MSLHFRYPFRCFQSVYASQPNRLIFAPPCYPFPLTAPGFRLTDLTASLVVEPLKVQYGGVYTDMYRTAWLNVNIRYRIHAFCCTVCLCGSFHSRNEYRLFPHAAAILKVCSATSSQGIRGYIYVMVSLKCTNFLD